MVKEVARIEEFYLPADGDDYLPAFNRWAAQIPAQGSGTLKFASRLYKFSNTINIIDRRLALVSDGEANIRLQGDQLLGGYEVPTLQFLNPNAPGIWARPAINSTIVALGDPYGIGDTAVRGNSYLRLRGLSIRGAGALVGDDNNHGLLLQSPFSLESLMIRGFGGNAIRNWSDINVVPAYTTSYQGSAYGNSNGSVAIDVQCWDCGLAGVNIKGGDVNVTNWKLMDINNWGRKRAGRGLPASDVEYAAILDQSFLGVTFDSPHSGGSDNGCLGYATTNLNANTLWINPYSEGITKGYNVGRGLAVNGNTRSYNSDNSLWPMIIATSTNKGIEIWPGVRGATGQGASNVYAGLCGYNNLPNIALSWGFNSTQYQWVVEYDAAQAAWCWRYTPGVFGTDLMRMRDATAAASNRRVVQFPGGIDIGGFSNVNGEVEQEVIRLYGAQRGLTGYRVITRTDETGAKYAVGHGPAIPTQGNWNVGDIVWNSAPASGQPAGWMCSVAGTPGTWVAMANLT